MESLHRIVNDVQDIHLHLKVLVNNDKHSSRVNNREMEMQLHENKK